MEQEVEGEKLETEHPGRIEDGIIIGLTEEYKDRAPHASTGRNQPTAASSSQDQRRRL